MISFEKSTKQILERYESGAKFPNDVTIWRSCISLPIEQIKREVSYLLGDALTMYKCGESVPYDNDKVRSLHRVIFAMLAALFFEAPAQVKKALWLYYMIPLTETCSGDLLDNSLVHKYLRDNLKGVDREIWPTDAQFGADLNKFHKLSHRKGYASLSEPWSTSEVINAASRFLNALYCDKVWEQIIANKDRIEKEALAKKATAEASAKKAQEADMRGHVKVIKQSAMSDYSDIVPAVIVGNDGQRVVVNGHGVDTVSPFDASPLYSMFTAEGESDDD